MVCAIQIQQINKVARVSEDGRRRIMANIRTGLEQWDQNKSWTIKGTTQAE